jgi:cytochrome c peroxidase
MKSRAKFGLVALLLGLALSSCDFSNEPQKRSSAFDYLELEPTLFSTSFREVQIELGRALFYDKNLSLNNTTSCASCHKQEYAFGDNVGKSFGFNGELTLRNTLPLVDLRGLAVINGVQVGGRAFWDGRKSSVKEAVTEPIINHLEMGMPNLEQLSNKLQAVPYYPPMFMETYGSDEVTVGRIKAALIAFLSIMNSKTSRFDQARAGQIKLTASEELGRELFISTYNCAGCHQGVLNVSPTSPVPTVYSSGGVNTNDFANIGLKDRTDRGLAMTTGLSMDAFRFRIPTLDNVAITAPYMHDGSLATLEEVIEHYATGITQSGSIDQRLRSGAALNLVRVTAEEKKALVDFLLTLTDTDITTDPRFSDPFKQK